MSTGGAAARRAEQRAAEDRRLALQAAERAERPSFFEQMAEDEYRAHKTWRDAKDYRKPPPGLISLGYGDAAQRQRMRERSFNMADTGLAALGGEGNATALQMAKLNLNDEFERDQAETYENAVAAEDAAVRGRTPAHMAHHLSKSMGIASLYNSNAQTSAQLSAAIRPTPILPGLISGAFGAGSSLLFQGLPGRRGNLPPPPRPGTMPW